MTSTRLDLVLRAGIIAGLAFELAAHHHGARQMLEYLLAAIWVIVAICDMLGFTADR